MAKSKKILSGNGWSFEPAGGASAPERASLPPDKQRARVAVEKRPKGKVATVISGFSLSDADQKSLATALKKRCGSGGSAVGETVEIQGDHRDTVVAELIRMGWTVR